MTVISERPAQTPCEWCGDPIEQPPTGRLLRYCKQAHRQRAYELRTAQARRQADEAAGRIHEPAERVVQRVVRPRYPHTMSGWEDMLAELAEQLRTERISPVVHAHRLRRALDEVRDAITSPAPAAVSVPAPRRPAPSPSPVVPAQETPTWRRDLAGLIVGALGAAGGPLTTTLQRLAADARADVGDVRRAVAQLAADEVVQVHRHGVDVAVDELLEHARFELGFRRDGPGTGGAS